MCNPQQDDRVPTPALLVRLQRRAFAEVRYCHGMRCMCEERLLACGEEIAAAERRGQDRQGAWLAEDRATLVAELVRTTRRMQRAAHRLRMLDLALYNDQTAHASSPLPWAMPIKRVQ